MGGKVRDMQKLSVKKYHRFRLADQRTHNWIYGRRRKKDTSIVACEVLVGHLKDLGKRSRDMKKFQEIDARSMIRRAQWGCPLGQAWCNRKRINWKDSVISKSKMKGGEVR